MAADKFPIHNTLMHIWHWMKNQIIQEVPEDIQICEYDCRQRQCAMGEREVCERRLRKAAGELMPDCDARAGMSAKLPKRILP